jgi:signal transduction histidine kinase
MTRSEPGVHTEHGPTASVGSSLSCLPLLLTTLIGLAAFGLGFNTCTQAYQVSYTSGAVQGSASLSLPMHSPNPVRIAAAHHDAVGTILYRMLSVLLVLAALIAIYLLRVKQVQLRYRQNLRTRYRERERVARDIHDTLLQGIQTVIFRLRDWETDPTLPAVLRKEFGGMATQAAATVIEARERILCLRGKKHYPEDLIDSVSAVGEIEAQRTGTEFRVHVGGRQRSLTVDAAQQLFDIGREAIRNAFKHAQASRVLVSIEYGWRSLRLEVRDDGRGIDRCALERAEGHFGLLGMCERTAELHGKFCITRLSEQGTAVSVVVPAGTAYRDGFRWLAQRA